MLRRFSVCALAGACWYRVAALGWMIHAGGLCSDASQDMRADPALMHPYELQVLAAEGDVSRLRDQQPWALSSGERVPVAQVITTGADGYARFAMTGGNSFEIFGHSRVIFRANVANTGDLVDVFSGRVRIHMAPSPGERRQRVFCPAAVITARRPSSIAIAIDEDNITRIDVLEGQVEVQHALLPSNEPVLVRAIDAILVDPKHRITRRLDRGLLYRYTARIRAALSPGHEKPGNFTQYLRNQPCLPSSNLQSHSWIDVDFSNR